MGGLCRCRPQEILVDIDVLTYLCMHVYSGKHSIHHFSAKGSVESSAVDVADDMSWTSMEKAALIFNTAGICIVHSFLPGNILAIQYRVLDSLNLCNVTIWSLHSSNESFSTQDFALKLSAQMACPELT